MRPIYILMKTSIGFLLCCLSCFAADTNEIRVVTRTDTKVSPGYLVTYEEFNRSGQTNLLRITSATGGVTNSVSHNFYYKGTFLGTYSQNQSLGHTLISSAAGAPYRLAFIFNSTNQVMAASVTTTNHVTLDSFTYTNGIFYPVASSVIEESNRRTKAAFQQ